MNRIAINPPLPGAARTDLVSADFRADIAFSTGEKQGARLCRASAIWAADHWIHLPVDVLKQGIVIASPESVLYRIAILSFVLRADCCDLF